MSEAAPAGPEQHIRILDVLTAEEQQTLIDFLRAHEDGMTASTIYPPDELQGVKDTSTRRSRTLFDLEDIWPILERWLEALLPHIRRELGLGWFELEQLEHQLTVHGDGDFFSRHADGAADDHRAITFVYYFNCEPKQFSGGQLRLYEASDDVASEDIEEFVEIEPTNNSIVLFPSWLHHEVAPVHSEVPGLEGSRFTLNGWFHSVPHSLKERKDGPGVRVERQRIEIDQELRPNLQRDILPHYTDLGFEVVSTPTEVHQLLVEQFEQGRERSDVEEADPFYQHGGDPDFLEVENGDQILEMLKPLHEKWAGLGLVSAAAYGIRINRRGQSLKRHCDIYETHVISSVVHIAAEVDKPWALMIEGHDGKSQPVYLDPGQMVLYESATCPHGRPEPLDGEFFASLFLHYTPADGWDWTEERFANVAQARGLLPE
jgi:Rps23 Pro-64 3,4-dihydroxylase Tpa1-like proline 4-hydroxylase